MVRTRALRFLIILGLVALLLPVSLAQADGHASPGTGTAVVSDAMTEVDLFAGEIPMPVPSGMIALNMSGVEEPAMGTALEAWLVTDDGERKQSLGILDVSPDGNVNHTWITDAGENLLLTFNTFVITLEPVPDDDPAPSDEATHSSYLDDGVLKQIRLLLDTTDPTDPAAAVNLKSKAEMAAGHARQARAAVSNDDLDGAKDHIGLMNAVIDGSEEDPGIAALAAMVAEAAMAAGEAAGEDEVVGNASTETARAANRAQEFAARAMDAGEDATEAASIDVATLHIGNVVTHAEDAETQAEMAYTGTQDMGTYVVPKGEPKLPDTGEPVIVQIVRYGLIASIVLVLAGSVMFLASRRRSGASAA